MSLIGSHKYRLLTVSDALTDSFRFVSLSVSDWSVSAAFVTSVTEAKNLASAEFTSVACAASFTTPNDVRTKLNVSLTFDDSATKPEIPNLLT